MNCVANLVSQHCAVVGVTPLAAPTAVAGHCYEAAGFSQAMAESQGLLYSDSYVSTPDPRQPWLERDVSALKEQARFQQRQAIEGEIEYFLEGIEPGRVYLLSEQRDQLPRLFRAMAHEVLKTESRRPDQAAFYVEWVSELEGREVVFKPQIRFVPIDADQDIARIAGQLQRRLDGHEVILHVPGHQPNYAPDFQLAEQPFSRGIVRTGILIEEGLLLAQESNRGGDDQDLLTAGAPLLGGLFTASRFLKNPLVQRVIRPVARLGFHVGMATGIYVAFEFGVFQDLDPAIRPVFVMGGMLASYEMMGQISESLVADGLLSRGFMGRPQWNPLGLSMPMMFGASVGTGFLLDGLGWEFGSPENSIGSVGITMGGYMAVAHYASQLAPLRLAYETAAFSQKLGAGAKLWRSPLVPRYVQPQGLPGAGLAALRPIMVGGRPLFSIWGGRIFLSSGIPAGASAATKGLALGVQAFNAVNVIGLGNWAGELAVSGVMAATGYDDDPDYKLMRSAYDTILREHMGSVGYFFGGAIARGMQSLSSAVDDDVDREIWRGIKTRMIDWQTNLERFAKNVEDEILITVIKTRRSLPKDPFYGKWTAEVNWTALKARLKDVYSGEAYPELTESKRKEYRKALKHSLPQLAELFTGTTRERAVRGAIRLLKTINSDGSFGRYRQAYDFRTGQPVRGDWMPGEMQSYLHDLIQRAEKSGRLQQLVGRIRQGLQRQVAQRAHDVGLGYISNGQYYSKQIPDHQLSTEQRKFVFGDGTKSELIQLKQEIESWHQLEQSLDPENPERKSFYRSLMI